LPAGNQSKSHEVMMSLSPLPITGLAVVALVCYLFSWKQVVVHQLELLSRLDQRRLFWLATILLTAPFIVILVVALFLLRGGYSELWLRLAHMIWVLGLWMIGTLALFTFILPDRRKITYPYLALITSFLSIPLAIYFTPVQNFQAFFPNFSHCVPARRNRCGEHRFDLAYCIPGSSENKKAKRTRRIANKVIASGWIRIIRLTPGCCLSSSLLSGLGHGREYLISQQDAQPVVRIDIHNHQHADRGMGSHGGIFIQASQLITYGKTGDLNPM